MNRKSFIQRIAGLAGAVALGGTAASHCRKSNTNSAKYNKYSKVYKWRMTTAWPKNLAGLGSVVSDLYTSNT